MRVVRLCRSSEVSPRVSIRDSADGVAQRTAQYRLQTSLCLRQRPSYVLGLLLSGLSHELWPKVGDGMNR